MVTFFLSGAFSKRACPPHTLLHANCSMQPRTRTASSGIACAASPQLVWAGGCLAVITSVLSGAYLCRSASPAHHHYDCHCCLTCALPLPVRLRRPGRTWQQQGRPPHEGEWLHVDQGRGHGSAPNDHRGVQSQLWQTSPGGHFQSADPERPRRAEVASRLSLRSTDS
eukprot:6186315-Pleurochrysis_carterae.AAC.2